MRKPAEHGSIDVSEAFIDGSLMQAKKGGR
jgi:hypothetical protein